MSGTKVHAFAEARLSDLLEAHRQKMLQEIQGEPANKLLNVNESDYVKYLADKYRLEPITLDFAALQVSQTEKMIPVDQHPWNFACRHIPMQRSAYPRQVITFHIPYTGDAGLLRCQP